MAVLRINKGAFPEYGERKVSNYCYTERGSRQTVRYIYSETDNSIDAVSRFKPTMNMRQVCGAGDPTAFSVADSNGNVHAVSWFETVITRTFNSGTAYEFTLNVISSARAIADGSDLGGFSFGNTSTVVQHYSQKDYHEYSGSGSASMLLDSNNEWTENCIIRSARSKLHGVFLRAVIENVYHDPTHYHHEVTGYEEVEIVNSSPLSMSPVAPAESMMMTAYNCELGLAYI